LGDWHSLLLPVSQRHTISPDQDGKLRQRDKVLRAVLARDSVFDGVSMGAAVAYSDGAWPAHS
jgi:hypothetical protein